MADLDILRKIKDTGYREAHVDIDSEEFFKVINTRRSVRVFKEEEIPDEHINKILEAGLLAPTSSNLQSWEFHWIKDKNKLNQVAKACLRQSAAITAPTIIIAVAKMGTWDQRRKEMLQEMENSDMDIPKGAFTYYNKVAKQAYSLGPLGLYGFIKRILFKVQSLMGKETPMAPTSYADMRVWAHKTTALACENIMLSARALGYDTCPMEGLDPYKMKELLHLDSKSEVCMGISIGKRADHGILGPRVRFDKNKFIKVW